MSTTVKAREFEASALKKGFTVKRSGNHVFYFYLDESGKVNPRIKTKVSHGAADISSPNLSKMKNQLKFRSMEEFQKYIACTLSLTDYRKLLKDQGF